MRCSLPRLALIPLALGFVTPVPSERQPSLLHPGYLDIWRGLYPESSSADNLANTPLGACSLCHKTSHTWNGYGWQMLLEMEKGLSPNEALLAIESLNSDDDPAGASNLAEIRANAQPGWTLGPNNTITYRQGVRLHQSAPEGISGRFDPLCDHIAMTAFRNGTGVNPACLTSLTLPIVGMEWRINVDAGFVPGADATLIVSHLQGLTGPRFPVGELLVDLSSPQVFVLARSVDAGTVHTILLPSSSALLGFRATMQGALVADESIVQLCNAVDYTMGCSP